jgi:PAS domain S-box-containing protein
VQELVRLHGGEIAVQSVEGRGTTFTVALPLGASHLPQDRLSAARTLASTASGAMPFLEEAMRWLPNSGAQAPAADVDGRGQPRSSTPAVAAAGKRQRILLADDNADMRDYLRRLLEPHFDVTAVGDGRVAFAAACENRPDLVLSDVMMPEIDGYGLVAKLRSHPPTSATPIILLSARAGEEARVEGLQHGADDYIVKPFSARELLARVASRLEMARIRNEATEQIQQAAARFRAFITATSDAVYRVSADWSELLELHGRDFISSAEDPGRTWIGNYIHPDDEESVMAAIGKAIAGRSMLELEHRVRRVDGSVGWVLSRAMPLLNKKGEVTEWFGAAKDITDRKRAEEDLRRRVEEIDVLVEATPALVWIAHDAQCSRITGNKAANSLVGAPAGANVSQTPGETTTVAIRHFASDGREIPAQELPLQKAVAGAAVVTDAELEMRFEGGRSVQVFGGAAPLFDAMGNVRGGVAAFLDITERKRAEQEVRNDLDALAQMNALSAKQLDGTGVKALLEDVMDTAVSIMGADKGSLQIVEGDALRIVAHQGHEDPFLEFFAACERVASSCGTAMKFAERVIVEDVEKSPIFAGTSSLRALLSAGVRALQSTPLVARSGRLLGILPTHWSSPHVPNEHELRRFDLLARQAADLIEGREAEAALRESEERLAATMKHLPIGVGVVDASGRIISSNPAWKQFVRNGIPSLDDDENTRWRLFTPDGQLLPRSEYPAIRALQGEDVVPGIDCLRKDDDDAERWTRIGAVPLRDAKGQVTGALALIQDIEEERRAERQRIDLAAKERALASETALRATEAEIARLMRALSVGELATSIAHEINQPLAGVVINAQAGLRWLTGETPNLEEVRESLSLIVRDGNRASSVIRRIREFLRTGDPERASLDLNAVLLEAVELASAQLAKEGVEVRMDLSPGLPRVRGDRIQLQQVILNLILNGAEAMRSVDFRKVLVLKSNLKTDASILASVCDYGVGIGEYEMSRMFDPLFTTKASGMGVGLSICRSIVEAHNGSIMAVRNDAGGLTVQFELPAESSANEPVA